MNYNCTLLQDVATIPQGVKFIANVKKTTNDKPFDRISVWSNDPNLSTDDYETLEKLLERTLINYRINEWVEMIPDNVTKLSCPACESDQAELLVTRNHFNEPSHIRAECVRCHCIYTILDRGAHRSTAATPK